MPTNNEGSALGVVAIGRNEGDRLRRCLESVRGTGGTVVYVDSGSQDGSVAMARTLGVEVIELDLTIPFTAARARNEGWRRLRELRKEIDVVQFIDGDCELMPGWISAARKALLGRPDVAVVCGRRRERFPAATVYNRLCDLEWDTPVGEAEACGGDALMRVPALERVGGFDPSLIAGEEPDLCLRLRKLGYVVLRIDAEMTLHDADMTRASQWWRRMVRSGYAAAESLGRHGAATPRGDRRCIRGAVAWAIVLPTLVAITWIAAAWLRSITLALVVAGIAFAGVGAQTLRIAVRRPSRGKGAGDAFLYAVACMAGKLPQSQGHVDHTCLPRIAYDNSPFRTGLP
jgi:GT2 family glycosyltransferase